MTRIFKHLPFQKHVLHSRLIMKEIHLRLGNLIETGAIKRNFFTAKPNTAKEYEGSIMSHCFQAKRIIRTKNSFLPNIEGKIETAENGAKITLLFKLPLFILVVCGIMSLALLAVCFIIVPMAIVEDGFKLPMLVTYLLPLFMYLIIMVPFKSECKKSLKTFHELFEIAN